MIEDVSLMRGKSPLILLSRKSESTNKSFGDFRKYVASVPVVLWFLRTTCRRKLVGETLLNVWKIIFIYFIINSVYDMVILRSFVSTVIAEFTLLGNSDIVGGHNFFTLLALDYETKVWSRVGTQGLGKREIPEETHLPATSSVRIPTCGRSRNDPPEIEPVLPGWEARFCVCGADCGAFGADCGAFGADCGAFGADCGAFGADCGAFGADCGAFGADCGAFGADCVVVIMSRNADKIYFKRAYNESNFAIGSEFIMHALDDSKQIADLQGNKKRIPRCQVCGNTWAAANEQTSEASTVQMIVESTIECSPMVNARRHERTACMKRPFFSPATKHYGNGHMQLWQDDTTKGDRQICKLSCTGSQEAMSSIPHPPSKGTVSAYDTGETVSANGGMSAVGPALG
ncbi:hypothetical protein PR048_020507 [Dryococelus australis]|uniref:Chitin-binding type-1 domain-containing protein n=1 Tax=Dryococelus australis TaxID=614101 RepID=A0ABQ9H6G5_9NEOP|nr:hypothetical protein PR048_020507 [Dryococelus australis]